MRSTAAPQNDDAPEAKTPAPSPDATFAWPPPDDVLQNMAVIDFVTGETRPLKLEPPPELAGHAPMVIHAGTQPNDAASGTEPLGRAVPQRVPVLAGGTVASRRSSTPWTQRTWAITAVVLIAIAGGMFGAWRLRTWFSPAKDAVAATAAGQAPTVPSISNPPVSLPAHAPADAAAQQETQPTSGASGTLAVRTDTAGARVWIDGVYRGRTPVSAADLPQGTHNVSVEAPGGRITQSISVSSGSTASVFVATGASAGGGISVSAPSELEVREGGRVVGTSRAERILLDPGHHTLDLVNDALGYASRQIVDVVPGKFQPIAVQFPDGSLSINALPWAEVFVDGQRVGETPIGNLKVRVGSHQVTFRHPDLGEVTRTVDVTLRGPARLSVNLERKEP